MEVYQPTVIQAPVKINKRSRAGSWKTFDRRYKPILGPDGSYERHYSTIGSEMDSRFVWTLVDCDRKLYVVPGFATVNYMARILCENPWSDLEFDSPGYLY